MSGATKKSCITMDKLLADTTGERVFYNTQANKEWWENSHINPSRSDPGQREKLNLNFYFHTSLWYLKRFYEGL